MGGICRRPLISINIQVLLKGTHSLTFRLASDIPHPGTVTAKHLVDSLESEVFGGYI